MGILKESAISVAHWEKNFRNLSGKFSAVFPKLNSTCPQQHKFSPTLRDIPMDFEQELLSRGAKNCIIFVQRNILPVKEFGRIFEIVKIFSPRVDHFQTVSAGLWKLHFRCPEELLARKKLKFLFNFQIFSGLRRKSFQSWAINFGNVAKEAFLHPAERIFFQMWTFSHGLNKSGGSNFIYWEKLFIVTAAESIKRISFRCPRQSTVLRQAFFVEETVERSSFFNLVTYVNIQQRVLNMCSPYLKI